MASRPPIRPAEGRRALSALLTHPRGGPPRRYPDVQVAQQSARRQAHEDEHARNAAQRAAAGVGGDAWLPALPVLGGALRAAGRRHVQWARRPRARAAEREGRYPFELDAGLGELPRRKDGVRSTCTRSTYSSPSIPSEPVGRRAAPPALVLLARRRAGARGAQRRRDEQDPDDMDLSAASSSSFTSPALVDKGCARCGRRIRQRATARLRTGGRLRREPGLLAKCDPRGTITGTRWSR